MISQKLMRNPLKKPQKPLQTFFSVENFFRKYISAMKSKALFFNYPFSTSKRLSDVLVCLEKNRRIAGYKLFPKNQEIKVFLSYDLTQNKPLIPEVIYYSSQGRTRSASLKNLQQFNMQNPNSLTLIGTTAGIMDIKSCLFHKCGGEFLVSLI